MWVAHIFQCSVASDTQQTPAAQRLSYFGLSSEGTAMPFQMILKLLQCACTMQTCCPCPQSWTFLVSLDESSFVSRMNELHFVHDSRGRLQRVCVQYRRVFLFEDNIPHTQ